MRHGNKSVDARQSLKVAWGGEVENKVRAIEGSKSAWDGKSARSRRGFGEKSGKSWGKAGEKPGKRGKKRREKDGKKTGKRREKDGCAQSPANN
jgi:hypothetical protein